MIHLVAEHSERPVSLRQLHPESPTWTQTFRHTQTDIHTHIHRRLLS